MIVNGNTADSFLADIQQARTSHPHLGRMFSNIIDILDIAIWELDLNYRIVSCNEKARQTYGDGIIGQPCHAAADHADTVCTGCPVAQVYRTNRSSRAECHHTDVSGSRICIDHIATPITDNQGVLSGVLVLLVDITNRKRLEEALERQHIRLAQIVSKQNDALADGDRKFQAIFNQANDAIFMHPLSESGRLEKFVEVNGTACQRLGYTRDEFRRMSPADIDARDDLAGLAGVLDQLRADGQVTFETVHQRKNGTTLPVEITSRLFDLDGSKIVLSIARDITIRKATEAALVESQKKYKALYANMNEGVCLHEMVYDANGTAVDYRIVDVNAAYESIVRLSAAEAVGALGSRLYKQDRAPFLDTYAEVVRTGRSVTFETFWEPLEKHIAVSAFSPIRNMFATVFTDITERKQAEETLKEREAQLRTLVHIIPDLIWLKDPDGIYLSCNSRFERFFGAREQDIIGKTDYDFVDKQLAGDFIRHDRAAITQGKPLKNEEEIIFADDGHREIIETIKTPIYAPSGKLTGVLGVGRDITERKNTENALRESEEKFRLTFDSSPDAININRLRDGLFVDINHGFTQVTGFTRQDVLGKTSLDIGIWHDPADRQTMVRHLLEKGCCVNLEARFRRKDGSLVTGLMSARIIALHGERHIVSVTRDITERVQALAERERLLLAIEQTTELIAITDAAGAIQYANPAFEATTGYARQEALGRNPRLLKSGHHDETFYQRLWQTISAGSHWTGRLVNRRKNGTLYTAECSISPIRDDHDQIANYVWISRDITYELELGKRISQAQKMEAIGALAGGIAHDFNNLLFPISGLAEMLMDDTPQGSLQHENAEEIFKAAKRAGSLVKQILSFSRQSEHSKTPVRVQQILKEVFDLTRATIPSNITMTMNLQADCGLVLADPTQVHQIAMNLVTNAYHAVEAAGGKIAITLTETELAIDHPKSALLKPGRYALISVGDTGHGIAAENLRKIFEPYFTTKENGKGTGLGLSVVYGIVREHGGDVQVASAVGQGTTFNVYLPLMKKEPLSLACDSPQTEAAGNERVLVVDDEAAIVRLQKQTLERLGYHATVRTSSIEALEAFRAAPEAFDVVITDMAMPNMTGDQLARKITAIRPDTPILLCTGFSEKLSPAEAERIGIRGVLLKPVLKSDMAAALRKALAPAPD
jgi:PAS domain S-box-containing protein